MYSNCLPAETPWTSDAIGVLGSSGLDPRFLIEAHHDASGWRLKIERERRRRRTARCGGDVQHAYDEAVNAKDQGLRVHVCEPARWVCRGPDGGEDRQGQILFSDELTALLVGKNADPEAAPSVPVYRRQAYAMAVYTKARASELEALTADDVELEHQTITIAKQADPTTKGRFVEGDPLQRAIVFHDLRDTGLTHMAVRGDRRCTRRTSGTTRRYGYFSWGEVGVLTRNGVLSTRALTG